jgi:flagellin
MSVGSINNTTAFSVYSNYAASASRLQKSMSRLSSGVKSVVDDGAGVGISERMRSQAASTSMARNNVDNAISVLQTADGWMQEISDTLNRMHELAIESNDATKTDDDRANIEEEFSELKAEIVRIVDDAAKFNGKGLLNGSTNAATQVGADSGQTITLNITNLSAVADSVSTVSTAGKASNMIAELQTQIDAVGQARAAVGGLQARFEHTRAGLLTYEDNIRAAESKIRDVDMARESSELMKNQILTQAGNAMLAQANQLPQSILSLFR